MPSPSWMHLLTLLSACSSSPSGGKGGEVGQPDDTADSGTGLDSGEEAAGPVLTIVVEGSTEEGEPVGPATQTPEPYRYGLQRLELLRSLDDPEPARIFDYAPGHVLVDMHQRNEVARVSMASLEEGTYPWFRIVLTVLEMEVDATLHEVPVVGTTSFRPALRYALSDIETDELSMRQGDVVVSGEVQGTPFTASDHWTVGYPEPAPGAWAESIDGLTYVTFTVEQPLRVAPEESEDRVYVVRYHIRDAFRWQDQEAEGYAEGTWDVTVGSPPDFEPVTLLGASAYEVFEETR